MKIKYMRVVSDLHLEQFRDRKIEKLAQDFIPVDDRDVESVLVLAGDISSILDQLVGFIQQIEQRFLKVIYVPGNHEYYGKEMDTWNANATTAFHHSLKNTISAFGDVKSIKFDNVNFIFGTLWADGGPTQKSQEDVSNYLYDFKVIYRGGEPMTVPDMIVIHEKMKNQIEAELSKESVLTQVVITHHLPSYSLCHPRFGAAANGGFASKCDYMINTYKPDFWIHGHTHDTYDVMLYDTRIICNPRGYAREFSPSSAYNSYGAKFIEL